MPESLPFTSESALSRRFLQSFAISRAQAVLLDAPRIASLCLCAALVACGSADVPRPPLTAHAWSEFKEVDSPPPVPHPERIEEPPTESAVWVDGYWVSRGGIWIWRDGGWVNPPAGARIALWKVVYDRSGRIMYAPSTWRDAQGKAMDAPVFLDARHQKRRERRERRRQQRLRQRELMR